METILTTWSMWDAMTLRQTQKLKVKHIYIHIKYYMKKIYEYYGEYWKYFFLQLYSFCVISIIFQAKSQDYWEKLSTTLFTGLFVCSMKINCLYVIWSQKMMIKLLICGAFQEKLVSYLLCAKICLSWNLSQMLIFIWTLNPPT